MAEAPIPRRIDEYIESLVPERAPELARMEAIARERRFPAIGPACGQYAYLTASESYSFGPHTLFVLDLSDPTVPVEEGSGSTNGKAGVGAVEGGFVYVYLGEGGMQIFRECGVILIDGFESGDTSAWSSTVP